MEILRKREERNQIHGKEERQNNNNGMKRMNKRKMKNLKKGSVAKKY